MNTKKKMLVRVYLVYFLFLLLGGCVVWRLIKIQFLDGNKWLALENKMHRKQKKIDSDRGSIYSAEGNILSASIPFYDLYLDFNVPYVRTRGGGHFYKNIDSLSFVFAQLFEDKSAEVYARLLREVYDKKKVVRFKRNISYEQKKKLLAAPLVRQGRYRSGFQFVEKSKRQYPYGMLAKRTLGFVRDTMIHNVGLESTYDDLLRGQSGYQPIRYIAGGVYAPVDGYDVEPDNGKDIITTIDMRLQDITENALLKMLKKNNSEWGTAIVMEVKTGKIKAIANLGLSADSLNFYEKINYALRPIEPGSTFKLVSMLALLEDKHIDIEEEIPMYAGVYQYAKGAIMKDSEKHRLKKATIKEAFAMSSNVGISHLVYNYYKERPERFLDHIKDLHLDVPTGIDIVGEQVLPIKNKRDKSWNAQTSLPWMSIGYEISLTPIQMLVLYNAVANNGTMLRPYLVSDIYEEGKLVKHIRPEIIEHKICSNNTLAILRTLLLTAAMEGTTKRIFKNQPYKIAGKTGTSLFYGTNGYKANEYVASFIGFFPYDMPLYTCAVFVKNQTNAIKYYGAQVAGPVFKEIADKVYALYNVPNTLKKVALKRKKKIREKAFRKVDFTFLSKNKIKKGTLIMPDLHGKNIVEIIEMMEKYHLQIETIGKGERVIYQSVPSGVFIKEGAIITVQLG